MKTIEQIDAEIAALQAALAQAEAERDGAYARAAEVCEEQQKVFGSDHYATGQPFSSFNERFACGACADAIRQLKEQHYAD
jgi:hypothetical protein